MANTILKSIPYHIAILKSIPYPHESDDKPQVRDGDCGSERKHDDSQSLKKEGIRGERERQREKERERERRRERERERKRK